MTDKMYSRRDIVLSTLLSGVVMFGFGWISSSTFRRIKCRKTDERGSEVERDGKYYIVNLRSGHKKSLTPQEFQQYFEFNIGEKNGYMLEFDLIAEAIRLDYRNLRLLMNRHRTNAFEQLAVDQDIEALKYCVLKDGEGRHKIHDYAYKLYGKEIYQYIP